jgi:hypothetical protein
MFWLLLQIDLSQSYLNLKNCQPPVLKAGSSGKTIDSLNAPTRRHQTQCLNSNSFHKNSRKQSEYLMGAADPFVRPQISHAKN